MNYTPLFFKGEMANRELIEFLSGFMTDERNEAFDRVLANRTRYLTVVLEDVYQAHNASAVLRSCDCFGIQDVHMIERRNSYKVSRDVALGADKWLTLNRYPGRLGHTPSVIASLREKGYRIVATSPREGDVSLEDFNLESGPAALLFGTELEGLSPEAIINSDEFLRIPMFGFTESFNISVSVALILHSLVGRLQKSDVDWHLSNDESLELKLDWLRKSIKSSKLLEKQFYMMNGIIP